MSTPQLDASVWVARDDSAERGDTRRLAHIVRAYDGQAKAGEGVLLGFACDAGVARNQGRVGAAAGPAGIRKFLAGLPAHGLTRLLDAGDVACEGDALEAAQDALGQRVAALLGRAPARWCWAAAMRSPGAASRAWRAGWSRAATTAPCWC